MIRGPENREAALAAYEKVVARRNPARASPNPEPPGLSPLTRRILPEAKKLIAAVRLGNKKWEEKVRAKIAKATGKTGVVPSGLTDEEKKDAVLLAKRIACAVEISKRPKKERPDEPIAVCRSRVTKGAEAKPNPGLNPLYLVPVASVFYLCDPQAEIGLCPRNPDEYYEHRFSGNAPLFDTRTFRIHGKVKVHHENDPGIHDWPSPLDPREVENFERPRWRVGWLDKLVLANGRIVPYHGKALLYTDESRTRLFAVEPRRNGGPKGLRAVADEGEHARLAKQPGLVAFYWHQPGCTHCEEIEPRLPVLAGLFSRMFSVDAAKLRGLADREGIKSTPRIVVYLDGEKVETLRGLPALADAAEKIGSVDAGKTTAPTAAEA